MKSIFCILVFFISCSSVKEESKPIRREAIHLVKEGQPVFYTLDNRKDSNYQFMLRSNNCFELFVFRNSHSKYAYYAGTFRKNKHSLYLNFLKDYRPNYLTTNALITNTTQELILLAKGQFEKHFS